MSLIGTHMLRCNDAGAAVGVAHLVESEVADRLVMSCGKEMHRVTSRGSMRSAGPADPYCMVCPPRSKGTAPKDASDPSDEGPR